ncbi:DUF2805 domain-containing protein [Gilvirhabdus luticola]
MAQEDWTSFGGIKLQFATSIRKVIENIRCELKSSLFMICRKGSIQYYL